MSLNEQNCKYCGRQYPEKFFHVALTVGNKIYRRRKCRNCYRATKQSLIDKHYEWIAKYKAKMGCSRCKIMDPRVLDFHHKDKNNKLFTVGGFRREIGFARLLEEIEKCVVVCANCHRILHDEMRRQKKSGE